MDEWLLFHTLTNHVVRSSSETAVVSSEAEAKHEDDFNYSILSVGVFTLVLLLIVQWIRLYLDRLAHGRPLFKAVLEQVNHELATLGVVEFAIFLAHNYLDEGKEKVFANVHYTLFLIVAFNAFQPVFIAVYSSRVSSELWVKAEQLNTDHYVEIREEFDRVDEKLFGRRKLARQSAGRNLSSRDDDEEEEHMEFVFQWTWRTFQTMWDGVTDWFRHPRLALKHHSLLTQIRFHELRLQLIQEMDLPPQLKISDYLKRSESEVFVSLVHLSTFTSVMLTMVLAVTYFLMGMVGYVTHKPTKIGTALFGIYVASSVLFVVVSLVVNNKMKYIFNQIIHKGRRHRRGNFQRDGDESSGMTYESQLQLFWQADPQLVISIVRFIEAGYSLLLAVLFVYWTNLKEVRLTLGIVLVVCFGIFFFSVSRTLPRYTLCTSLGQLVNEERLHATLAHFRLQETKRLRRQQKEEKSENDKNVGNNNHKPESTDERLCNIDVAVKNHKLFSELVHRNTASLRYLVAQDSKGKDLKQQSSDVDEVPPRTANETFASDDDDDHQDAPGNGLPNGGQSDMNVIAVVRMDGQHLKKVEARRLGALLFGDKISSFFLGEKFKLISIITGTLPALLLVGTRVEILLELSQVIPSAGNTFKSLPEVCFWLEASILISVIISSIFIMILFRPSTTKTSNNNIRQKVAFVAASLDILIAAVCFILLFVAEARRCCGHDPANRFLTITEEAGGGTSTEEVGGGTSQEAAGELTVERPCCPRLGTRSFGGIGNIEPFTSLITLRILRFVVASKLLQWMEARRRLKAAAAAGASDDEKDQENPGNAEAAHQSNHHTAHSGKHAKKHKGHHHGEGTVVELWEQALSQYPSIAKKYGEFSSELLQAMLGIDILETNEQLPSTPVVVPTTRNGFDPKRGSLLDLDRRRYSSLVSKVQGIMLAGTLSKSVKSAMTSTTAPGFPMSNNGLLVIDEAPDSSELNEPGSNVSGDSMKPQLSSNDDDPPLIREHHTGFEMVSSNADAEMDRVYDLFDHPTSCLVQSLCRCDRKFLPYLERWSAVEVALTKYELVYFHDAETDHHADGHVSQKMEEIRQAIVATNGGKGLRLCDVAYGRRFAGRVKLMDCVGAHVHRYLPSSSSALEHKAEGGASSTDVERAGFRQSDAGSKAPDAHRSDDRWEAIHEDHLVLLSDTGTLQLRFLDDLAFAEANIHLHQNVAKNENENDSGGLLMSNALLWCQAIVRFCGPNQLRQSLPHYGENNDTELSDFLHVMSRVEIHRRGGMASSSQLSTGSSVVPKLARLVGRFQILSQRTSNNNGDEEERGISNVHDKNSNRSSSNTPAAGLAPVVMVRHVSTVNTDENEENADNDAAV